MEELKFIANEDGYQSRYLDILELDNERQRRLFYGSRLYSINYVTRKETDTHIYWSLSNKEPKLFNNKFFFAHKNLQGVTYDKKTKSIKIWFGQKIYELERTIVDDILNTFDCRWVHSIPLSINKIISTTIFKRILKKKITTQEEICRDYFKVSPFKDKEVDIDLYIKTFENYQGSTKAFNKYFTIAQDCNVMLKFLVDNNYVQAYSNYLIEELVNSAIILDKPIDFKMSIDELLKLNDQYGEYIRQQDIIYEFFNEYDYERATGKARFLEQLER